MPDRRCWSETTARRTGWVVAVLIVLELISTVLVGHGLAGRPGVTGQPVPYSDLIVDVGIVGAGVLLTTVRPRNPIGWLMLVFALLGATQNAANVYGIRTIVSAGDHLPLGPLALSLGASLWIPALFIPVTVLVVLYPDGRLPARWWRWVNVAAVVGMALLTVAIGLAPGAVEGDVRGERPVAALPHAISLALGVAGGVIVVAAMVASIGNAVLRAWRAEFPQRQQLLWLLTTAALAVAVAFLSLPAWIFDLGLVAIPAAIVVGVLRYRLLGVELIVRRTILYGSLTVLVIVVYTVVNEAVAALVPSGPIAGIASAATVAVLLVPVRDRMQRGVDRLVYGARHDPLRAVRGMGAHLAATTPDPLLAVVQAVAASVRAGYAAVVDIDGTLLAETGSPTEPRHALALSFNGDHVADLVVSPHAGEATLAPADHRIIEALAVPVAVVVHAGRLNRQITIARERLVAVTMTERQRIRRDLHDGLGPSLSGTALGLEAVEASLREDPERAAAIIERLREEVHRSVEEVRRIIDALRPTALDEHGLVAALRERAAAVSDRAGRRLSVRVDAPESMPELPGAVEVAAYRIADEAITNVVRHAGASVCMVSFRFDGDLTIEVRDNGRGLPLQLGADGVGLTSMRQRSEELGGSFHIADTTNASGTTVIARIPLEAT